jgi:hypothetical protein
MQRGSPWRVVGAVVLVGLLIFVAARLQAARERSFPLPEIQDDSLYIDSAPALKRVTVSLNTLAADMYWIRAIQYYGGTKLRLGSQSAGPEPPAAIAADRTDYNNLYKLLDLTTSLDPRFDIAYRFGAVFLAEGYPNGPGSPELAVRLLEKGLRERPDRWQYMQDIGFVYYWYYRDYRAAAKWFDKASEVPGAPNWLKPLAATTLAQGGDRRSSRVMWLAILQSAEVDWLRRQAEHRLTQLRALDEIDDLQRAVDRYVERTREPPRDWETLVRARVLRGVPADPTGTPYVLSPDGRVELSSASKLFPLPTEPERAAASSR